MKKISFNFFRKIFISLVLLTQTVFFAGAQNYTADQQQGFEAFRKNDWTGAMFFLRKAGSTAAGYDEETLYMLVMSEINAGEYKQAYSDANLFIQKFSSSSYAPYMDFQKGRILYLLGKNEDAVLVLSDFCHQNQDSELYASALYWIAEAFYAEYNFDSARALYERIVADFPSDPKVTDARYRIEMIAQREREEKLVYLLKVTGEENLSAREEYERQLRLFQSQDKMGVRKALSDAENRIAELEALLSEKQHQNEELQKLNSELTGKLSVTAAEKPSVVTEKPSVVTEKPSVVTEKPSVVTEKTVQKTEPEKVVLPAKKPEVKDPEVEALKRKAKQLEYLLEEQKKGE